MDTSNVEIMGKLAEEAYSTYEVNDSIRDLPYKVLAVSDDSSWFNSGFQGMLVEEVDAQGNGTGKYFFGNLPFGPGFFGRKALARVVSEIIGLRPLFSLKLTPFGSATHSLLFPTV
jgi:hypothetical protein